MPYIHGGPMIHVPRPAAKTGWAKFSGKAKQTSSRAKSKVQQKTWAKTGNVTSSPARRVGEDGGGKFGERSAGQKEELSDRRHINTGAAITGGTIGAFAAAPLGIGAGKRDRQIEANKKKLAKRFGGAREQVHLITDVGTKAGHLKVHHPGRVGMAAIGVGAAGTGGLELNYRRQQKKTLATQKLQLAKKPVSKARSMSDSELRHRQKIQGKIARTTSTLGLTGLAVTGAGALAAGKGRVGTGTLKAIRKIPKMGGATPEKMKNAAINTGIVSGGIGGVGGFNQASIYSAESRRRKQAVPVKKDYGMDLGFFGEEGHARTHEEIETEIAKAWEPVARSYDPEAKRHARAKKYETGLTAASGGAAAGAVVPAVKAGKLARKNSKINPRALNLPSVGTAHAARKASAVKSGKVAAGLAGAAAVSGAGAALVHHGRKNSWQTYEKRDATSAFGVDHSDNPNGQHRETEN